MTKKKPPKANVNIGARVVEGYDAPHCVVTGAAQGIGRAIATAYMAAGYTVTGIDIKWNTEEEQSDGQAVLDVDYDVNQRMLNNMTKITADLSNAKDLATIVSTLKNSTPISVFVHNAGVNFVGKFEEIDAKKHLLALRVNLLAPILLSSRLCSADILKDEAKHIFISSMSRFVSYPGATVYAATKNGIAALSRNLRVAGWKTLTVYPGPTKTQQARECSPDNSREANRMTPEDLAQKIFNADRKGQNRLSPGAVNTFMRGITYTFPSIGVMAMKRVIFDKLGAKKPNNDVVQPEEG